LEAGPSSQLTRPSCDESLPNQRPCNKFKTLELWIHGNALIVSSTENHERETALQEVVHHLELERREGERQERELKRWEEEERRRKEEEKIKHLEKLLANWNHSQKIRQFLTEVERAVIENEYKTTANLTAWIAWARDYADSIDPIHLTFHSASDPENGNDS
jgi:DNA repair exonuclease SbcCD ATPase subunit